MFVEVLHGATADVERVQQLWAAVLAALNEGTDRWLGATAGTSTDGTFVGLLVFDSDEGARDALDQLAEGGVWSELRQAIAELTFTECPEVRAFGGRRVADASVVHIQRGTARDLDRLTSAFTAAGGRLRGREASAVIGGILCSDDTGTVTIALYESERDKPSEAVFGRLIGPLLADAVALEVEPLSSVVPWAGRSLKGSDPGGREPPA